MLNVVVSLINSSLLRSRMRSFKGNNLKIRALRFLLLILIGFASTAYADRYGNYYSDENVSELSRGHLTSRDLKRVVSKAASRNHRPLGYSTAKKHLFGAIHLKKNSKGYYLEDVYCEKVIKSYEGDKVGPMTIPLNGVINCEHTWPQSRFNRSMSKNMQKSDLHHLYPTDSKSNSVRGNFEFAEVYGEAAHANCQSSLRGDPQVIEQNEQVRRYFFEPPAVHKGNVARALFYFSTKYNLRIAATEEKYLRAWHIEDPIDQEEIDRNSKIMGVQGNRNPFIDFPLLVNRISDF